MTVFKLQAEDVRLSAQARGVLERGDKVEITRYGKPFAVLLDWDQFNLLEPLLEILQGDQLIPREFLMTKDDLELARDLATDRETTPEEEAMIDEILASQLEDAG